MAETQTAPVIVADLVGRISYPARVMDTLLVRLDDMSDGDWGDLINALEVLRGRVEDAEQVAAVEYVRRFTPEERFGEAVTT